MTSDYATKLYSRIQAKNKKGPVTIDMLIEDQDYQVVNKIISSIQELRVDGLVTIKSIKHRGRFENEIIPKDGYVEHSHKIWQPKTKMIVKKKR
jgi:hypothetical protein